MELADAIPPTLDPVATPVVDGALTGDPQHNVQPPVPDCLVSHPNASSESSSLFPDGVASSVKPPFTSDVLLVTPAAAESPVAEVPECLTELFAALDTVQVRWCVLRNSKRFESDIDILVAREDQAAVLAVARNLRAAQVTALVREPDSLHLFLANRYGHGGVHLHFIFELSWKGVPFLDVDLVLDSSAASPRSLNAPRASEPHAALATLLEHLLADRVVKTNQRDFILQSFQQFREIRELLSAAVGPRTAERLASAVQTGRWQQVEAMASALRRALILRKSRRNIGRTVWGAARYHVGKLRARFRRSNVVVIAFLGPDGSGKTSLISYLSKALARAAGKIELQRVRPHVLYDRKDRPHMVARDPHGAKPQPRWVSLLKLAIWSFELRLNRYFTSRQTCTIQLFDRYYHDVLSDPCRYRFRGPIQFAKSLALLTPEPDLWVLLEASPATLIARKQELPLEELARLSSAYRAFCSGRPNVMVINAEKPAGDVADQALLAILRRMTELATAQMRTPS